MTIRYAFIIFILILLTLYILQLFRYSSFNTIRVPVCTKGGCDIYNVHKEHHDPKQAAIILNDIVRRNSILFEHLKSKYASSSELLNPNKNNRIDLIPPSALYNHDNIINFMNKNLNKEFLQERVTQLLNKYDDTNIYEISPKNSSNATSFTENKTRLVLCLRNKLPNKQGYYKLHNVDLLMFVVLHELAHMMNDKWGHPEIFWELFKFMLLNAVECKVYNPSNYRLAPVNYCGLNINYNPLYDPTL